MFQIWRHPRARVWKQTSCQRFALWQYSVSWTLNQLQVCRRCGLQFDTVAYCIEHGNVITQKVLTVSM